MNKISLKINDSSLIEELLEPNELKIIVREALCEGIAHRILKVIKKTPELRTLSKEIEQRIFEEIKKEVFCTKEYFHQFSEQYKEEFKDSIENLVNDYLQKEYGQTIRNEVDRYKRNIEEFFDRRDAENIFRNECWKFMESRMKK